MRLSKSQKAATAGMRISMRADELAQVCLDATDDFEIDTSDLRLHVDVETSEPEASLLLDLRGAQLLCGVDAHDLALELTSLRTVCASEHTLCASEQFVNARAKMLSQATEDPESRRCFRAGVTFLFGWRSCPSSTCVPSNFEILPEHALDAMDEEDRMECLREDLLCVSSHASEQAELLTVHPHSRRGFFQEKCCDRWLGRPRIHNPKGALVYGSKSH